MDTRIAAEAPARPASVRSLASKFSLFTAMLVFWVTATFLAYDLRQDSFDIYKGLLLCLVVVLVAGAIARFTIRLLVRPLQLLIDGITKVQDGHLEPVQVCRTGDEIEYVGESFNQMIDALRTSREENRRQRETLEQAIQERTEQYQEAMQSAVAANRAKSDFLANMSHELRTPMNGVIGMLEMVLDSRIPTEQREHLETAQRCAYSLLSIVNDILDISKIEAGKMSLEQSPFHLHKVFEDCLKAQLPKAQQKGIALIGEIEPNMPAELIGDVLRLRQILNNLLSNAVKFTEKGSVVARIHGEVSQDRTMAEMHIEISDTGPGIASDKLDMIFDEFTQADGSISRRYGGTGLGLAIAKKLVEVHKGTIRVVSEVGQGSCFQVDLALPINTAAESNLLMLQPRGVNAFTFAPHQRRVLVVEDNLVNQRIVTAILNRANYQVIVANHGQEALNRLEEGPISVILMDVQMPVMDGLEATRRIRMHAHWAKIPIIAMTAHAMNGDRDRCISAGMDDYLSKPVHPGHLLSIMEQHLAPRTELKVRQAGQ